MRLSKQLQAVRRGDDKACEGIRKSQVGLRHCPDSEESASKYLLSEHFAQVCSVPAVGRMLCARVAFAQVFSYVVVQPLRSGGRGLGGWA